MEDKIIIDLEDAKLLKEYSPSLVSFGAKVKKMMGGGSKMTKGYARGGAKVGRKK